MIKKRSAKIFLAAIALVAVIAAGGYAYTYYQLSQIKHVAIPDSDEELGIGNGEGTGKADGSEDQDSQQQPAVQEQPAEEQLVEPAEDPDTVNIALFGVERQEGERYGRSDSIIILSIDYRHSKIKLSSIMRDTYVYIEGHGRTKLNHAYAYGGPALAIKTINSNFGLNIKEFVTVNFEGFKRTVDLLGGVQMEIKDYELPTMRTVGIYSAGTYNLTGEQALAYARIRKQGNGDYERTDRQRRVLEAIFEKIKGAGIVKFPSIASAIVPHSETSLSADEIMKLGTSVFAHRITALEEVRFPLDSVSQERTINGVWYLVTDLDETSRQMKEFIYDDTNPLE